MEERGGWKREEGMRKGETYTKSTINGRERGREELQYRTEFSRISLLHNCESVFVGNYLCVFGIIIPL